MITYLILSYWIFRHLYRNDFNINSNVDSNLVKTPYTSNDYDTEIKLTKDKDGNWLISQEDYKTLTTELLDRSEGYSSITYDKPTKKSDSLEDEDKKETTEAKQEKSSKDNKSSKDGKDKKSKDSKSKANV